MEAAGKITRLFRTLSLESCYRDTTTNECDASKSKENGFLIGVGPFGLCATATWQLDAGHPHSCHRSSQLEEPAKNELSRAHIRPPALQLRKMAARALARVTTRSLRRRASSAAATAFIEPPPFEPPAKDALGPFADTDALDVAGRLTEDEVLIRATARQYCQEKLAPRLIEANRHELVDRDIFR